MKLPTFAASVLLFASILILPWSVFAQVSSSITATVKISVCGNGVIEGGEDCEGSDLNGTSCSDISGFASGTLACDISCSFDTSGCIAASPTPTPTPTPTAIPTPTPTPGASNSTTVISLSTNTPTPVTPIPTIVVTNNLAKGLPTLVQLFGNPATGTIPVQKLRTVLTTWVASWKQANGNKVATNATVTCDANHDGTCDVRDFSVLLYYVQ